MNDIIIENSYIYPVSIVLFIVAAVLILFLMYHLWKRFSDKKVEGINEDYLIIPYVFLLIILFVSLINFSPITPYVFLLIILYILFINSSLTD